jgi:selenide, water dikinase
LGVGVLSAALKKQALSDAGYAAMVAATTQLNKVGPALAQLEGVHAMTDVTGFGLAGHALEMARGSLARVTINWDNVPLLEGVADLAAQGMVTGASGRNWAAYGEDVQVSEALLTNVNARVRDLLSDPQTSGGLLVACAPEAAPEVLALFQAAGFDQAQDIGAVASRGADGQALLTVV